ncbi:ribonuclease H-like domain-containing protein [Tanacetum coccineum]
MTHKLDDIIKLPKSLPKKTIKEDLECEIVMVKIPRCMSFLGSTNTYDEHLGDVDKMKDEVGNPCPQSTSQVLPSFEVNTPPVTYPEEVDETLGTLIEEEPLDHTKLKDIGLTNRNISLSSREVPSFDEPEPQPQPLPSCPSLDVSLGDERGPKPPIKPHISNSFRMKLVDSLTIHTPPSPQTASFHPKDISCYYHPCVDDPKKHYGFKLGDDGGAWVDIGGGELVVPRLSDKCGGTYTTHLRVVLIVEDALEALQALVIVIMRNDNDFANLDNIAKLAKNMADKKMRTSHPLVFWLLKLALVLQVATATVERRFTKMKLIRTDLRNQMRDDYFNDALTYAIEKE